MPEKIILARKSGRNKRRQYDAVPSSEKAS